MKRSWSFLLDLRYSQLLGFYKLHSVRPSPRGTDGHTEPSRPRGFYREAAGKRGVFCSAYTPAAIVTAV